MDFFFLILLTAVMLIRPEELFTDITGARLYLWTIAFTTLSALHKLGHVFTTSELARRPIACCVLGLLASVVASSALGGKFWTLGQDVCDNFVRVVLYFFLVISILDTPERLRHFLGWIALMVCGVGTVAALHYYEVVDFPLLQKTLVEARVDPETGNSIEIRRALASGIFGDPNDLCLILTLGMLACVYQITSTPVASARLFWSLPIAPLFFVLSLTGSRGGMLGLLGGFAAVVYARIGLRIGVPLIVVGTFALLAFAGGRAAEISGGGTARDRLSLWGGGLSSLFAQPTRIPFGLGPGWYESEFTLLAHNSFINAYVELGIFGGGFFLVAFLSAFLLIDRAGRREPLPDWAAAMRPVMLAIVVAYAAGCFSLSRHLILPTYLVLGLASAYISLIGPPPPEHTVDGRWFRRALVVMVLGLVVLKFITQLLGQLMGG